MNKRFLPKQSFLKTREKEKGKTFGSPSALSTFVLDIGLRKFFT